MKEAIWPRALAGALGLVGLWACGNGMPGAPGQGSQPPVAGPAAASPAATTTASASASGAAVPAAPVPAAETFLEVDGSRVLLDGSAITPGGGFAATLRHWVVGQAGPQQAALDLTLTSTGATPFSAPTFGPADVRMVDARLAMPGSSGPVYRFQGPPGSALGVVARAGRLDLVLVAVMMAVDASTRPASVSVKVNVEGLPPNQS